MCVCVCACVCVCVCLASLSHKVATKECCGCRIKATLRNCDLVNCFSPRYNLRSELGITFFWARDQSTVAQRAEMTVDERSLTIDVLSHRHHHFRSAGNLHMHRPDRRRPTLGLK